MPDIFSQTSVEKIFRTLPSRTRSNAVNPLFRTPFFAPGTKLDPGPIRAPIPHFSGSGLVYGPDWDPPTPCLMRSTWRFSANGGSDGLTTTEPPRHRRKTRPFRGVSGAWIPYETISSYNAPFANRSPI